MLSKPYGKRTLCMGPRMREDDEVVMHVVLLLRTPQSVLGKHKMG